MGINHGGDSIRSIVKSVDELETQRAKQRDTQHHVRPVTANRTCVFQIAYQMSGAVSRATDRHDRKEDDAPLATEDFRSFWSSRDPATSGERATAASVVYMRGSAVFPNKLAAVDRGEVKSY